MAHIRTNREILTKGKSYASRKAKKYGTDEVTFNKESRLDYLTGFHKRKLHRQKMAAKFNEEQKRLEKIEERKKVAEERKREMEERMRRFRESLDLDVEPEAEAEEEEEIEKDDANESDKENLSEESWHGFSDDEDESDGNELKSILKVKPVSKITYADDTTVEIGSMEPNENFEFIAKMNNVKLEQSEKVLNQSITRATKYAKFLGMEDEDEDSQKRKKKKPKKKFRYLTKNERKENQRKAVRNKRRK